MRPDSRARGSPTSVATGRPPGSPTPASGTARPSRPRTSIGKPAAPGGSGTRPRRSRPARSWCIGSRTPGVPGRRRWRPCGSDSSGHCAATRPSSPDGSRRPADSWQCSRWAPEHGYLRYVTAMLATDTTGMPDEAEAAASELREMELAYGSRALGAFALVLAAHAKILRGDADAGFDLLDEAMLPVVAGEVDPLWGGDIYCTVIHLTGRSATSVACAHGRTRSTPGAPSSRRRSRTPGSCACTSSSCSSRRVDGTRPPPSWDP